MVNNFTVLWNLLEKIASDYEKYKVEITFNQSCKQIFADSFECRYQEIKEKYMDQHTEHLDRHKIAAIFVVEGINANVITRTLDNESIFIGQENLLYRVAFSYITQACNITLKTNSEGKCKELQKFTLPKALSCNTTYVDVMCRYDFYDKKYSSSAEINVRILKLAEKFFLLEYIAILSYYGEEADEILQILKEEI